MKVKINKTFVEKAEVPVGKDQVFYRDSELKGFALRVTAAGTKSFVVEKNIGNKIRRITLGKYGALTAEQARKEAQKTIGQIATGIDPIAEKQGMKINNMTLNDVFNDYKKARKSLKHNTLYNYERVLNVAFAGWGNKSFLSITKDKVAKHHEKLGKESGEAYANLAMRLLRALFNFAAGQYEDAQGRSLVIENPVKRLSQTRAWYRVERRQTFIKAHELAPWYAGVQRLENETLRDYLLLIILTGLRRQEAATLRWDQVDLKAKTLTVLDTKNHESHTLPLSNYLYELLLSRSQKRSNEYVFSGAGAAGHIIEPRKQMANVTKFSGIHFTVHDLRRTFITIAEGLDISAYALKRLMNHKMSGDITAGYIVTDVERLRKPMQQITDYFLKCMGVQLSALVLEIQPQQGAVHEQ
ncbi:phage-related integrase [Legionella santicrucis]|uniref:Phage-related integrase n=1 Tax=Legionella santicrucis TaxID=45074 RepID=A0A0W0YUB6_9GAMM|nr:integrase family protein [Legionella santicrucis]KTD60464.1 phage-related integrase [Legionella santicrucis]